MSAKYKYIECRNERKTIHEWAAQVGLTVRNIRGRISRGYSIEDAIFKPFFPSKTKFQDKNLCEWASISGLSIKTLRGRIKSGCVNVDDLLRPLGVCIKVKNININGVKKSAAAWARHLNITREAFRQRLLKNWTPEELLSAKNSLNQAHRKPKTLCKDMQRYRIHKAFNEMHRRCYNTNFPRYADYGGRGIIVSAEWSTFPPFYEWALANGHQIGLQLDRFPNNDGNYEPSNCRWATRKQQQNNTRRNVWIEWRGERKTVSQWADELGLDRKYIYQHVKKGYSLDTVIP